MRWIEPDDADDAPLERGGLLLEVWARPWDRPVTLLRLGRGRAGDDALLLRARAGALDLLMVAGGAEAGHRLDLPPLRPREVLRVAFAFDAAKGRARLSAFLTERGVRLAGQVGDCPGPLARDLVRQAARTTWATAGNPGGDLIFAAVSANPVGPGPLPSIDGSARVATPDGWRRLADLAVGDLVNTPEGGPAPVRWAGRVDLPACGTLAPVRLAAPWHGLDRDLVVAAGQAVVLTGRDVEYLFGLDRVAVGAQHLGEPYRQPDGPTPRHWRWHQIGTEGGQPIRVDGAWLLSHPVDTGSDAPVRPVTVLSHAEARALARERAP